MFGALLIQAGCCASRLLRKPANDHHHRLTKFVREFLLSISDIETGTRIEIETILARIFGNYIFCFFID